MNIKRTRNYLIGIVIFLLVLELLSRVMGIDTSIDDIPRISPKNLYMYDSVLGWKNSPGTYRVYNDNEHFFECTIDRNGNRFSGFSDTARYEKEIHVYGCSYIFGYSLADSSTCCYKLQQMLPNVKVVNKGVPAYGLAQMYLSIKQSVKFNCQPDIAIFNYSDFHDLRRPMQKQWGNMIRHFITQNDDSLTHNMKYPYFDYENDSLYEKYCGFDDLPSIWLASRYFSFASLLNAIYFLISDGSKASYNHLVSKITAAAMMKYCIQNDIIPIFANIRNSIDQNTISQNQPPTHDIQAFLNKQGMLTFDYGIDIMDKRYNCFPIDEGHPNGLAHSVFAKGMYDFLLAENLVAPPSAIEN